MRRKNGKMRHGIKTKQKITLKSIMIYSACSALLIIAITTLFNISDVKKVKAKEFEIKAEEEQIFNTDFSLPSPQVKFSEKATPVTIFIQKKRPEPVTASQNHD